jgi:hypothetical protein
VSLSSGSDTDSGCDIDSVYDEIQAGNTVQQEDHENDGSRDGNGESQGDEGGGEPVAAAKDGDSDSELEPEGHGDLDGSKHRPEAAFSSELSDLAEDGEPEEQVQVY